MGIIVKLSTDDIRDLNDFGSNLSAALQTAPAQREDAALVSTLSAQKAAVKEAGSSAGMLEKLKSES